MESQTKESPAVASPIANKGMFITDGGLETTLVFHQHIDLPHFAAVDLLKTHDGYDTLRRYYDQYASLARKYHKNFILESPTWRANPDWAAKLGYHDEQLAHFNKIAIEMMKSIKQRYEHEHSQFLISGCIGPRGDGYKVETKMNHQASEKYHWPQIKALASEGVDMISGVTMTYVEEALGIANAAAANHQPAVISFTVETDGRLPSGQSLKDAILQLDQEAKQQPAYYMINCAHPSHFAGILEEGKDWLDRIQGIRANASRKSHAELDESEILDEGNPAELGQDYKSLFAKLRNLKVVGGCCGTDHRHVEEICKAIFV